MIRKDFYLQVNALIKMIKLLYHLIKNQEKLPLGKELSWNVQLHNFASNIEKATIEVKRTFLCNIFMLIIGDVMYCVFPYTMQYVKFCLDNCKMASKYFLTEWTFGLCEQRLHFIHFQQNAKMNWKTIESIKMNIKKNLEQKLAAQV